LHVITHCPSSPSYLTGNEAQESVVAETDCRVYAIDHEVAAMFFAR